MPNAGPRPLPGGVWLDLLPAAQDNPSMPPGLWLCWSSVITWPPTLTDQPVSHRALPEGCGWV